MKTTIVEFNKEHNYKEAFLLVATDAIDKDYYIQGINKDLGCLFNRKDTKVSTMHDKLKIKLDYSDENTDTSLEGKLWKIKETENEPINFPNTKSFSYLLD